MQVVVGQSHTCILDDMGAVRCFGQNRFGQLGAGPVAAPALPVPLPPCVGSSPVLAVTVAGPLAAAPVLPALAVAVVVAALALALAVSVLSSPQAASNIQAETPRGRDRRVIDRECTRAPRGSNCARTLPFRRQPTSCIRGR